MTPEEILLMLVFGALFLIVAFLSLRQEGARNNVASALEMQRLITIADSVETLVICCQCPHVHQALVACMKEPYVLATLFGGAHSWANKQDDEWVMPGMPTVLSAALHFRPTTIRVVIDTRCLCVFPDEPNAADSAKEQALFTSAQLGARQLQDRLRMLNLTPTIEIWWLRFQSTAEGDQYVPSFEQEEGVSLSYAVSSANQLAVVA